MKNKIIYILLIVIVIEGLFFAFKPNLGSIRTDSGWDSDYSSSSSSSSSGSYSSSYSGSSSGDSLDIPDLSFPIVVIIEIIFSVLIYIAIISFAYKWKYRQKHPTMKMITRQADINLITQIHKKHKDISCILRRFLL